MIASIRCTTVGRHASRCRRTTLTAAGKCALVYVCSCYASLCRRCILRTLSESLTDEFRWYDACLQLMSAAVDICFCSADSYAQGIFGRQSAHQQRSKVKFPFSWRHLGERGFARYTLLWVRCSCAFLSREPVGEASLRSTPEGWRAKLTWGVTGFEPRPIVSGVNQRQRRNH